MRSVADAQGFLAAGDDRERHPGVPPLRAVLGGKFLVALEVEIALHRAHRQDESDLRPDTGDPRLEAADPVADAAVATELLVEVPDQSNLRGRRDEARRAPIEMRVDAVLVQRILVLEIVGEAEHAGEFPAGVRVEIGVAGARIQRLMTDAEIGEPVGIVSPDRDVAGDIGHDVVHAHVPAQVELRRQIAESRDGFAGGSAAGKSERADGADQRRVDVDAHSAVGNKHHDVGLRAEYGGLEHIAWRRHGQVGSGLKICIQAADEVRGDPAARHLARERDRATCLYRSVIAYRRERKSRLLGRGGEAAEKSRHPEADAAFIGFGRLGRCDAGQRDEHGCGAPLDRAARRYATIFTKQTLA